MIAGTMRWADPPRDHLERDERMPRRTTIALGAALATLVLSIGCERKNTLAETPPPLVNVAPPLRKAVTTYLEYSGITKATASVELRARVKGVLQARLYDERKNKVAKDQPLMVIEEDVYKARVAQAQAKL